MWRQVRLLCEVVWLLELLLDDFTIAAASTVEVCSILVSNLSARLAATVLPALDEPGVPVRSDYSVVQPCSVDVSECVFRINSEIILHETETAGCPLEFVQTHNDLLYLSTFAEEFVELLLCSVVAHIAHIQSRTLGEKSFLVLARALEVLVPVAAQVCASLGEKRKTRTTHTQEKEEREAPWHLQPECIRVALSGGSGAPQPNQFHTGPAVQKLNPQLELQGQGRGLTTFNLTAKRKPK